jgi:hypothetical protein
MHARKQAGGPSQKMKSIKRNPYKWIVPVTRQKCEASRPFAQITGNTCRNDAIHTTTSIPHASWKKPKESHLTSPKTPNMIMQSRRPAYRQAVTRETRMANENWITNKCYYRYTHTHTHTWERHAESTIVALGLFRKLGQVDIALPLLLSSHSARFLACCGAYRREKTHPHSKQRALRICYDGETAATTQRSRTAIAGTPTAVLCALCAFLTSTLPPYVLITALPLYLLTAFDTCTALPPFQLRFVAETSASPPRVNIQLELGIRFSYEADHKGRNLINWRHVLPLCRRAPFCIGTKLQYPHAIPWN